jgi:endonuclease/exonuclease/phosphatase family metal-dependent hydrolase
LVSGIGFRLAVLIAPSMQHPRAVADASRMKPRSRWRAPALVALAVCAHATVADPLAVRCDPAAVPSPRDDRLRIVVWNLCNVPGDHDLPRLHHQLDALAPHVIALQEVLDPAAAAALRPGFRWHASQTGGRNGQRVMIGWDPAAVEVGPALEHHALTMDGRVRPALSAHVRAHARGPDFHLVVVHLKATRGGHEIRRMQWPLLVDAVRAQRAVEPTDDDVLVVGDFNLAGGPEITSAEELDALALALAPAGLRPWETVGGCTAYWDGRRRDAWHEPSRLDLVWSAGLSEVSPADRRSWPGTHCARHHCQPFAATEHHPDPDLHGISDHCPIVIDLPRADDDP